MFNLKKVAIKATSIVMAGLIALSSALTIFAKSESSDSKSSPYQEFKPFDYEIPDKFPF